MIMYILLLFFLSAYAHENDSVDLLIYSYDRPLQVYACLESMQAHMVGVRSCTIIYRISNKNFAQGYEQVKKDFPGVCFIQQRPQADDFKQLTLAWLKNACNYVMFAVDDIVVTEAVNVNHCVQAMERYNGYGFYLRLGKNITIQSMGDSQKARQLVCPPLMPLEENIFQWTFADARGEWAYAHSLDMTIYRKNEVHDFFKKAEYKSPNSMEAEWTYYIDKRKKGLCYEHSKIVNIPLNCIQKDYKNYSMGVSTEQLLALFNEGFKIDYQQLSSLVITSPHMAYNPTFITRNV